MLGLTTSTVVCVMFGCDPEVGGITLLRNVCASRHRRLEAQCIKPHVELILLLSEIFRATYELLPRRHGANTWASFLKFASETLLPFWCRRHETLSRRQLGHRREKREYSISAGSLFWTLFLSLSLFACTRRKVTYIASRFPGAWYFWQHCIFCKQNGN
jgi:hypothetical protein